MPLNSLLAKKWLDGRILAGWIECSGTGLDLTEVMKLLNKKGILSNKVTAGFLI
jgi:hypothetical protein